MADDPRERQIAGWDHGVALYPIRVTGVPAKVHVYAGTTYPDFKGHHAYSVYVETEFEIDPRAGRRMLAAIYRGLAGAIEENRKWDAAARLGAASDAPGAIPWSRPGRLEAHCFWIKLAEYPRPVLGVRTNFSAKNKLRDLFDRLWRDADGHSAVVSKGWWPEGKIWWLAAEHAYPRFLGLLRREGFKLKWFQRADYPPAPPVENAP